MKKKNNKFKIPLVIVSIIVAFLAGWKIQQVLIYKEYPFLKGIVEVKAENVFDNSLTKSVLSILKTDFINKDKIDEKKIFYSALKGLTAGVADPYTVFLDPEEAKEFNESITGAFQGIGAEIGIRDNRLTIVAPLPETPAENAGLLAGDKVFAIDGFDTTDITIEKAVKMIRGPQGTQVTLLVVRGDDQVEEIVITRDVIKLKSVTWEAKDNDVFYIKISSFNQDTVELFNEALFEMKAANLEKLIIDLRNNPGGLLDVVNEVAGYWVNGASVVVEKFADGRELKYSGKGSAELKDKETVVLVNGGSASASEILAGALKDYKLVTLVGEKTFGKGSVQELKLLPDGSYLKVTIAHWLTPNKEIINEKGIEPDIKLEFNLEGYKDNKTDNQLDKALEILK